MERLDFSLKGEKVLITGATGFIGSHLTRRLLKEGTEIHILIKKDSNIYRIKDIIENLAVWQGDVQDYPSLYYCIKKSNPRIIFHLATLRNVTRNMKLIEPMIDINIKGTLNIFRGLIENKTRIKCFINTGTCEEYGGAPAPFYESQREMPVSPYSASKVAATYFCQMISKTINLPIIILRPFLTYGPFQDTDMFIPSLINHCLCGKDFPMTEGNQTRDFIYVDDIVDAYLLAATFPNAIGEIINIGSGIEYRIKDVAKKIVNMMGKSIRLLLGALPKRPGETSHFFCDNEKAKRLLNWSPRVNLDEGLEKTIRWYKDQFKNKSEHV